MTTLLKVDELCVDTSLKLGECQRSRCDKDGACVATNRKDGQLCGFGACGKSCDAGKCVVTPAAAYDDQNPCTKDFCNQGVEVVHEPITDLSLSCDDGDACTQDEYCTNGKCVSGGQLDCDDRVACTKDGCDKSDGCLHTADPSQCNDDDPCTKQACDLAVGCTITGANPGVPCDDGNKCTGDLSKELGDVCAADGSCGGPSTCSCVKDADCNSGNKCIPLRCEAKLCQPDASKAVVCDPANDGACEKNTCDPYVGKCVLKAVAENTNCDDGDECTVNTTCKAGVCAGGGAATCDDKNDCTADSCSTVDGCVFSLLAKACDDGNLCTSGDTCTSSGCVGTPKQCEDGVACSFDSCDRGCQFSGVNDKTVS